jgi:hypothetical protein
MKTLERRLARVGARLGPAKNAELVDHMTDDELEITILDLARTMSADPTSTPEKIAEARARITLIEGRITAAARKQQSPEYKLHLAWLRRLWDEDRRGPYVCDLLDQASGYGDWERPNVMARRQALRERADIAALIRRSVSPQFRT